MHLYSNRTVVVSASKHNVRIRAHTAIAIAIASCSNTLSMAKIALFVAVMALYASGVHGAATMTLQSGKIVNLDEISANAKGKCCFAVKEIGLGVVDGDQTIVRMDGSNGKYYVTNDPNCGNIISSSSYLTTFSHLYVCGQCKGGCPQVDGGRTLIPKGGNCGTNGQDDITKRCISSAPVCMTPGYTCVTLEEASKPPAPAACASFANLGQDCSDSTGKCCAGGPKDAKCENGKCVSTFPTPAPAPAPAVACATFANLGQDCSDSTGKCCGGAPKNAKCENGKCVSTYPSGRKAML